MRFWGALFACLLIGLSAREYLLAHTGGLQIHFFGVGQGDAVLLQTPGGQQIIVDGGPNLALLEHLGTHLPFLDRRIELLILTHPDADHLTALPELLRRYTIGTVLLTGAEHSTSRYQAFIELLRQEQATVLLADPKEDIVFPDGVSIDVLWPPQAEAQSDHEVNHSSVAVRVLYGEQAVLLPGDIGTEAETAILASGADVQADILLVPHHGSRTSSSTGFLLAVDPELAVVSSGKDNSYGHPHPDVLDRYTALHIPVRRTDQEGTISLLLTGKHR